MKLFISKITFRILSRILNKFLCLKTKINRENIIICKRNSLSQRREKLNFPTNFGDKGDEEEDPFSGSPASIFPSSLPFSSAQEKNKRKPKKKRMTQNIDACAARNDRKKEGRKRSRGEEERKKERKKEEGTMRRVSSWPINFLSPPSFQLFSPRVYAQLCF